MQPLASELAAVLLASVLVNGCASPSLVDVDPPNSVADPAVVTTPAGAVQLYQYAIASWASVLGGTSGALNRSVIESSGIFTDELMRVQGGLGDGVDERNDGFVVGLTTLEGE